MTIGIEQLCGATLGNQTQNLKPVQKYNPKRKPTFGQSIKRHLLSPVDCQLMGLVAILLLTKTKNNQRLGDLWADTLVVDLSDKEANYNCYD